MKNLAERIYKKKTINKINKKVRITNLNFNVEKFLIKRIIVCLVIYAIISLLSNLGLLLAPFITVFYYHLIEYYYLDLKIEKRKNKMEQELILFIETIIITLTAQKDLKKALITTCTHLSGELVIEFERALNENTLGKSLSEAFDNMITIMPNQNVISLINILNQASNKNIVEALHVQLKYLKSSEGNINRLKLFKTTVNLCIITLIFFIPLILLIIYSPEFIDLLKLN